jgi:2-keto-4-pentenoate hydratase/2-oxohepta-3-ene-1,7-dioic acid hydratase in catechol pathway
VAVSALAIARERLGRPLTVYASLLDLTGHWEHNLAALSVAVAEGWPDAFAVPLRQLRIHAPLTDPGQVICAGANYRKHVIDLVVARGSGELTQGMSLEQRREAVAAQMDARAATGEPYAWSKPVTAIAGPDDDLVLPRWARDVDWELELAVVIGRPTYQVSRAEALAHVAGYMVVNDVTARDKIFRPDLKGIGTDWLVGKGAPGFLPCGPFLVPRSRIADPYALRIVLKLNGETMQDESVSDMLFGIERLIEYVAAHVRLSPGDILCTGSPAGNGAHFGRYLRAGDVMEGSIAGLGTQTVRCVDAA